MAYEGQYPNIILLVLDAVRADRLTCYGYHRATSPFIDELTAQSILYEKCFAPANWSVPSHASLFTGLYPSAHNTDFRNLKLPSHIPTLAEILGQEGYATCAITSNAWISSVTNLHRGFMSYYGVWPSYGHNWMNITLNKIIATFQKATGTRDKGGQKSVKLAHKWFCEVKDKQPFFLFMNLIDAHGPYGVPRGADGSEFVVGKKIPKRWRKPYLGIDYTVSNAILSKEDLQLISDLYDAGIRYVDGLVCRLIENLREMDLYDSSMIIITSDHGESLGDDGILGHQFKLTDDLLHVPLIIKMPKNAHSGKYVSQPVQLVDLMPTLLCAANVPETSWPTRLEGWSILLEEIEDIDRKYVIAEDIGPEVGVVRRRHGDEVAELWDVDQWMVSQCGRSYTERSDGTEKVRGDMSDDELASAKAFLEAWRQRLINTEAFDKEKQSVDDVLDSTNVSPEILKRLRDLGYID